MAGILKPNVKHLGEEASYEVVSFEQWHNLGKMSQCGLFDNKQIPSDWGVVENFYFCDSGCYVEIIINDNCNIWRLGNNSYSSYYGKLKIEKKINDLFIDVTKNIKQEVSEKNGSSWEKTIFNLPKGHYKFSLKGDMLRMDDEWYIEKSKECKYLLKQNDKYYSIKENFYDKKSNIYLPCKKDFNKNGMESLFELIKIQTAETIIGEKEIVNNGSLFSFPLQNIQNIKEVISNKNINNLKQGDRKDLIKINCSNGLVESGEISYAIDGRYENNLWFCNNKKDGYIIFEFPYPILMLGINIIQDFKNSQGIWKLYGGNDKDTLNLLSESIEFDKDINKITNTKCYKFYKLEQKNGETSRSSYIKEIEFDIKYPYYLLINRYNEYFTIKNNKINKLNFTISTNDFYIENGFNILEFNYNLIESYFKNTKELKLYIYDNIINDKLKLNYNLKVPFKPIDCFKGEVELIQAKEK